MYSEATKIFDIVEDISRSIAHDEAETIDKMAKWPEKSLRELQQQGLGGLTIPLEYGGLGQGTQVLSKVCEILGYNCASTAICFGMHCVGSAVIASKVTRYQQDTYLTPICEGKHITSLSLSESGSGSHFYLPETRMQYNSEHEYKINGMKSFVTNGGKADSYVVSAVAEGSQPPGEQFNCVMIKAGAHGVKWGGEWRGLGLRGNSSRNMELNNVNISDNDILGQFGDQIWYVFNIITPYFLTAMAGAYVGIARAAIDEASYHIKKRMFSFNGRALASSSVIQYQLGKLWAKYSRIRALVHYATDAYDNNNDEALLELFSAKAEVAESVVEIVNEAMTLCGGIAYREGSKLDRMLRDARAAHVMSPTTDMLRIWTGRSILDQPLLSDT